MTVLVQISGMTYPVCDSITARIYPRALQGGNYPQSRHLSDFIIDVKADVFLQGLLMRSLFSFGFAASQTLLRGLLFALFFSNICMPLKREFLFKLRTLTFHYYYKELTFRLHEQLLVSGFIICNFFCGILNT